MHGSKKEHHKMDWGKNNLAPQHNPNHTIKSGTKLHDWLRLNLDVVEEGHEGSESVCKGIWMAVMVECREHLKPLAIVKTPLVVK
jgi:hypothetical protein